MEQGRRDESAALAQEVGFVWWCGVTLSSLANWLVAAGEFEEAERALVPAAEVIAAIGDRVNTSFVLAVAVWIATERRDARRAGMFWGALEAGEEREPAPAFARQRGGYDEAVRAVAGPEFERGRERGRTLTLAEALEAVHAPID